MEFIGCIGRGSALLSIVTKGFFCEVIGLIRPVLFIREQRKNLRLFSFFNTTPFVGNSFQCVLELLRRDLRSFDSVPGRSPDIVGYDSGRRFDPRIELRLMQGITASGANT